MSTPSKGGRVRVLSDVHARRGLTRLRNLVLISLFMLQGCVGPQVANQPLQRPADAATNSLRPDIAVMAPMRDGVKLATYIRLPQGAGPFPVILFRSVYPDGLFAWKDYGHEKYLAAGYAVVWQSTRGAGESEGIFRFLADDRNDGYDTVEWLAAQPWCDGNVGMDGASYLGMTQLAAAAARPPHLKAIVPQVPSVNFFREPPYFGGIFMRQHMLNWHKLISVASLAELRKAAMADPQRKARMTSRPLIDAADGWLQGDRLAQYQGFLQHPIANGYWSAIHYSPKDYARMDMPVLMVSGNFDFGIGVLEAWRELEGNAANRANRYLLIGPWTHTQTFRGSSEHNGPYDFGGNGSVDMASLKIAFFDKYLKGRTSKEILPGRVRLFITGVNVWRDYSTMPVTQAAPTRFCLDSGGKANGGKSDGSLRMAQARGVADEMVTDPLNPVVSLTDGDSGITYYNDAEQRDDVLVYTSEPLAEPITIIGEPKVTVHVSADTPDADLVVRLTEVYPDGRSLRLGYGGALRLRYHEGFDKQRLLKPGEIYTVTIPLTYVGHQIPAGHRLRLDIMGTEFPGLDPNPNTGEEIATAIKMRKATVKIFHDKQRSSCIELPVVE